MCNPNQMWIFTLLTEDEYLQYLISKIKIPTVGKTPSTHGCSRNTSFQLIWKKAFEGRCASNSLKRLGCAPLGGKTSQQPLLPEVQVQLAELFIVMLLIEYTKTSFIVTCCGSSAAKD